MNTYRMLVSFIITFIVIAGLDLVFSMFLSRGMTEKSLFISVDYAPEVWFALVALVLGTLVIVISIASQSIIKLIDLYMKDWRSLFYIWFMFLSAVHVIIFYDMKGDRFHSHFLNINVLLPAASVLALPYVFYILRYTKPENIITKIYKNCIVSIKLLMANTKYFSGQKTEVIEEQQKILFDALNQLDDFLTYTEFKEPRSIIIRYFCAILEYYIAHKESMPEKLYSITPVIESDISFRATASTFINMDYLENFFEKKCLRILGNAYHAFIEDNLYDLASLCASEMVAISGIAIERKKDDFLDLILVHLNTFFRISLKHALQKNEPRNLYNLSYHYRLFLEKLAEGKKAKHLIRGFGYLQFYGNEIYKNVAEAPHLYFIIDTIVFEMKMILLKVFKMRYVDKIQLALLDHFLRVDKPPELIEDAVEVADFAKSKARLIQISLGLYYLRNNKTEFVHMIIDDILDDIEALGKKQFTVYMEKIFTLLHVFTSTFWEDTDRGNLNIYYTGNREYIDDFRKMLFEKIA